MAAGAPHLVAATCCLACSAAGFNRSNAAAWSISIPATTCGSAVAGEIATAHITRITLQRMPLTDSLPSGFGAPLLDPIPDHRGHILAAEVLDRPNAGRRGDVDLGEETVDHVDADEPEPALAQRRADRDADLALACGQLGVLRGAATHHVGAQVVRRRDAVDGAGELAVDQDDALVALLHGWEELLHHPLLAEGRREQIVERAEVEVLARK